MTVTTTLLATGTIRSLGDQSSKLSAVLNNRAPTVTATDSSILASQSAQVDTQASVKSYPPLNLRVDTLSLAVAGSTADAADATAQQVSGLLAQLQSLASRANLGGFTESQLELISGQFQALRLSISNVQPQPPRAVPVASLLEGVPGGVEAAGVDANATIGGLNNPDTLLGDLSIDTPEAAAQALGVIAKAFERVQGEQDLIARVSQAIDFAAASTDGALANQEALRSTLSEGDLDGTATTPSLVATLQAQAGKAAEVQTSRLPANVLQLLS